MKTKIQSNLSRVIIALLFLPTVVLAEYNINGKSSKIYEPGVFSSGPSDEFKKASIDDAKRSAWEKYTQGFSPSKMKSYRQIESSILNNLDDYIIEANVLKEKVDDSAKRYTVIVRAEINTAKIDAKLSEISNAGSMKSGSGSAFSYIFVARQAGSVKSFDEKRTEIDMSEGSGYEKESAVQKGDSALANHEYKSISKKTTGGSTVRKKDETQYRLLSASDVDASMNQVLTAANFEVVNYDDVVSACGGTEPSEIKDEFTKNKEMSRLSRRNAIKASRDCEVSYFAVGTLNVGESKMDPVTGLQRTYVSVNSQVWNIDKRLPRQIASVGPVQFQGLGPDADVAQTNALKLAAKNVANEIVNQLNAKGLY